MRDRDQANVIWRRSRLAEDHRRFKVLRNNVVTMIRDAKDKYYESQLDPTLDSRTLWRNVNRLGLKGADDKSNELDILQMRSSFPNANAVESLRMGIMQEIWSFTVQQQNQGRARADDSANM
ncbi:hypothetical protein DMENIID0001_125390 [Sergentomyia squamirostris]